MEGDRCLSHGNGSGHELEQCAINVTKIDVSKNDVPQ